MWERLLGALGVEEDEVFRLARNSGEYRFHKKRLQMAHYDDDWNKFWADCSDTLFRYAVTGGIAIEKTMKNDCDDKDVVR